MGHEKRRSACVEKFHSREGAARVKDLGEAIKRTCKK